LQRDPKTIKDHAMRSFTRAFYGQIMKKFLAWIDEVDRLYAHPDPHEAVWLRSGTIIAEAGDHAARLGLTEGFQASRQFGPMADPLAAKEFLGSCMGACAKPASSQYLDAAGACNYLGITGESLYGLVERGHIIP